MLCQQFHHFSEPGFYYSIVKIHHIDSPESLNTVQNANKNRMQVIWKRTVIILWNLNHCYPLLSPHCPVDLGSVCVSPHCFSSVCGRLQWDNNKKQRTTTILLDQKLSGFHLVHFHVNEVLGLKQMFLKALTIVTETSPDSPYKSCDYKSCCMRKKKKSQHTFRNSHGKS